jgi:hypothetical protein
MKMIVVFVGTVLICAVISIIYEEITGEELFPDAEPYEWMVPKQKSADAVPMPEAL